MASLLRLAEADLKDAELLSSGRNAGNAPGLLQLAADRLVQAVLATEFGWPLRPEPSPASIADENPLKGRLTEITKASPWAGTPVVSGTGAPPDPPDKQDIRAGIRIARGILKLLANEFDVDLFGDGVAGTIAPARNAPTSEPGPEPALSPPAKPHREPHTTPRQTSAPSFTLPPAALPEPHEVEGRMSIELKRGPASTASTAFWTLMDRWDIADAAALALLGHTGGLTKKGTRPRFKLVGEEVELLRSFQEIDAALVPLQLDPKLWLHQPIKAAPFNGEAPVDYLTRTQMTGVHATLRFLLQHGLQVSMRSNKRGR